MKSASTLAMPDIAPPAATRSRGLRVALSTAFALPFLYSLEASLRGKLFAGRYVFFGDGSSLATFLARAVVSALGSLWLGVSIRLGLLPRIAERTRDPLAAVLMLAGVAGLLFAARLLALEAAA